MGLTCLPKLSWAGPGSHTQVENNIVHVTKVTNHSLMAGPGKN